MIVKGLEVVRSMVEPVPVKPEPFDVSLYGLDVLSIFLGRIGVVVSQVTGSVVFLGDAEVEAYGLRVPDVEITVGLGRETRRHPVPEFPALVILLDYRAYEVEAPFDIFILH